MRRHQRSIVAHTHARALHVKTSRRTNHLARRRPQIGARRRELPGGDAACGYAGQNTHGSQGLAARRRKANSGRFLAGADAAAPSSAGRAGRRRGQAGGTDVVYIPWAKVPLIYLLACPLSSICIHTSRDLFYFILFCLELRHM